MPSTVSFALAFAAGFVSFLSPCVFPLVPSYLTWITGMTLDELAVTDARRSRARSTLHAALFVLGFTLVFVALGATATAFGVLLGHSLTVMQRVGGVLIALFGLHLLGVLRLPVLMRERRLSIASRPTGLLASVLVGVGFGAGWTPCVGPVLASILLYAGSTGSMLHGAGLLTAYALGLGVPFMLAAFALNRFLATRRGIARWLRPVEMLSGGLLVLVGVMLATGRFSALSGFLAGLGQLVTLGA